jgi:hypothetical protein
VVGEDHLPGLEPRHLVRDEVGQGALDGLAVDVGPPGRRHDGHVRSQLVDHAAPMTAGVLVEDRAVRRLEQEEERPAVAAWAVAGKGAEQVLDRRRIEGRGHVLGQRRHPHLLLLERDAQLTQADGVGGLHALVGPHAAVQARVHRDPHVVAEVDGLPAGDAHHPLGRHPRLLEHPDRLVAPDEGGRRVGQDRLGAEEVVEVRVADHDPVAGIDVGGRPAGAGGDGGPVDVRVEEDRQPCGPQPERRAAVPVQRRAHR